MLNTLYTVGQKTCHFYFYDDDSVAHSGSALEVVLHDYALYKSTFTLLYFYIE